jgi:hypothetical protein
VKDVGLSRRLIAIGLRCVINPLVTYYDIH